MNGFGSRQNTTLGALISAAMIGVSLSWNGEAIVADLNVHTQEDSSPLV